VLRTSRIHSPPRRERAVSLPSKVKSTQYVKNQQPFVSSFSSVPFARPFVPGPSAVDLLGAERVRHSI
jgi:hypothetical protein